MSSPHQPPMLPYVDKQFDEHHEMQKTVKKKKASNRKSNPWNVLTIILGSLVTAFAGLLALQQLVFPNNPSSESNGLIFITLPAFGLVIAFCIASVIFASRKNRKKGLSWALLIVFTISTVGFTASFISEALQQEKDLFVSIPANYQQDEETKVASLMDPSTRITCDSEGVCTADLKFIAGNDSQCTQGGTFAQDMISQRLGQVVSASANIPPLKDGETAEAKITWETLPDDSLLPNSFPTLVCTP